MTTEESSTDRVLLQSDFKPRKYVVTLQPDFTQFTFDGDVDISLEVTKPSDEITLHSLDIDIKAASISNAVMVSQTFDKDHETVTVKFSEEIPIGMTNLKVQFKGCLNDNMCGFYRSKYHTEDGTLKYAAVTQFEPTDCRRAFPCFDEPALKAKFVIRVIVDKRLTALSNMPVESTVSVNDANNKDLVMHSYQETPIMSTYLVAIVIGEFDHVSKKSKKGIEVRVFTEKGKKNQGIFALECGAKILDFFEDYFNIEYALSKLDMIAISDFSAGAMENWGLVTYRETSLLIDEKKSSLAQKQLVAYVVAHELAHQWFGNLVTMDWWQDLWLNEGFATWVGHLAVDELFPNWEIWTRFVQEYINKAMLLDGLENSHPIEVDVKSSSEVNEIFDAISYCKGASVIRMIVDCVGPDNFQKGLRVYLKHHQFSNAATNDLWKDLSLASDGVNVDVLMHKWTRDTGYPVLSVTRQGSKLTIKQSRFLKSGKQMNEDTPWHVYVRIIGENRESHFFTMTDFETTIDLPEGLAQSKYLKLNPDTHGFYRVKYDAAMFEAIGTAIETNSATTLDRLSIVDDAFALCMAGMVSVDQVLTLLRKYKKETDYNVWASIDQNLSSLRVAFADHNKIDKLKPFIVELYADVFSLLGWEAKDMENESYALLRPMVLTTLGLCGHNGVIEEAIKRFNMFSNGNDSILIPDLRQAVYTIIIANGGEPEYLAVKELFCNPDSMHEERMRALSSLGHTPKPELCVRLLKTSLETEEIRPSDILYVYRSLGKNRIGRQIAWEFLRENFERISKRFEAGNYMFAMIISACTINFSSHSKANEVTTFFKTHSTESAKRTIKQSIESIESNASWHDREAEIFENYFK